MGSIKKRELRCRVEALDSMIRFTELSRNEILFGNSPLDEIIKKASSISIFFKMLSDSKVYPLFERYSDVKEVYLKKTFLSVTDWASIDKIFRILGKTNVDDQKIMLDSVLCDLNELRREAYEECERKGNVYLKTGLALGVFAVVICI